MCLSTNVTDLATRVATEAKSLRTLINGNVPSLAGLTTTDKTNLVAAITPNESNIIKEVICTGNVTVNVPSSLVHRHPRRLLKSQADT